MQIELGGITQQDLKDYFSMFIEYSLQYIDNSLCDNICVPFRQYVM